jgi:hypothetical protein
MVDHLKDDCVAKSNVLLLEWRHRIVAAGVQDEFLSRLFDAQVVPLALLFDLVLRHELFSRRGCIACCEGVCRVCSWVGRYHVVPGGAADDEPVLALGDHTRQMAVLLSLLVVVGLRHSEYSAKLVFELSTASGMITPLRRVSLSRREMSVSYAPCDAEGVIVGVVDDDENVK